MAQIPAGMVRKLKALAYPEIEQLSLKSPEYNKCILWLEEEKIRLLEKLERRGLRTFDKGWYQRVIEYCTELGVRADDLREKDDASKLRVLDGLLTLAVHDIYQDKVDANEMKVEDVAAGGLRKGEAVLKDYVDPLNQLLTVYQLPTLPADAPDSDIFAALQCIHTRVCPPEEPAKNRLDLDNLPNGIHTDDPQVRRVAAILRLIHGQELRKLQHNANEIINQLQQLTADPKTDSRLGRVGR